MSQPLDVEEWGPMWEALTEGDNAPAWADLLPEARALFARGFGEKISPIIQGLLVATVTLDRRTRASRN